MGGVVATESSALAASMGPLTATPGCVLDFETVEDVAGTFIHGWANEIASSRLPPDHPSNLLPLLVFSHDSGHDHRSFNHQVVHFHKQGYPIIVWDLRGHGRSWPPGLPAALSQSRSTALGLDEAPQDPESEYSVTIHLEEADLRKDDSVKDEELHHTMTVDTAVAEAVTDDRWVAPEATMTVTRIALDLLILLDSVYSDRQAPRTVLIGHGLGAAVSQHAYYMDPGRVCGMVCIGASSVTEGSPFQKPPWTSKGMTPWRSGAFTSAMASSTNAFVRRYIYETTQWIPKTDRETIAATSDTAWTPAGVPGVEVQVPLLLLVGKQDPLYKSKLKSCNSWAKSAFDAEVIAMPDCSSMVHADSPISTNATIEAFIVNKLRLSRPPSVIRGAKSPDPEAVSNRSGSIASRPGEEDEGSSMSSPEGRRRLPSSSWDPRAPNNLPPGPLIKHRLPSEPRLAVVAHTRSSGRAGARRRPAGSFTPVAIGRGKRPVSRPRLARPRPAAGTANRLTPTAPRAVVAVPAIPPGAAPAPPAVPSIPAVPAIPDIPSLDIIPSDEEFADAPGDS